VNAVGLHVADTAVARIAAARAQSVPGVVTMRGGLGHAVRGAADSALRRQQSLPPEGARATVSDGEAEVSLTIVTRIGRPCREVAEAVQHAVRAELAEQAGIEAAVHVTVADVLLD